MSSRRISRRTFTTAAVFAAAVGVPLVRAQGARPERSRVTIVHGSRSSIPALPLTIAEQLGYFRAEGVEVEFVEQAPAARSLQDGGAGPGDVVCGPFEQVVQLQGRGQFFQSFVLQGRAPQVAVGVSTRAMPGFRGVAQLRGHRVGVAAPGLMSGMVARLVLARGGLDPADVSYVGLGAQWEAVSSFRAGQLEAIAHTDPVITHLEQRGELRIIGDTRTLKGTQEIFGGPMPAGCLYAPQEFIQKNPLTCQALANGVVHALKWLQTAGPSDIIRTVPEAYFMADRALYLAAFNKVREAISPDGVMADEAVRTAIRTVARFDAAVRIDRIDASRAYTNDFARRAKDKFHA
ncbi:ABC transporter substrate-binding protein [Ramlibacter rhizophilus]|uniref:ABC transporter substrate-binding protein n=1 Tax=Ramlibacter rhizophilus TaxID=1781167 RepID=A0A4Z0BQR5_9BURK|nr:ABC transporter substrate-binding protein [Ramlibacter rhizophilus]TFZ01666.1 ABC transporter substrate-binding protein [Ramlibacter rhizophilus]